MISNETQQTIETNGSGVKLIGQVDFDAAERARIMDCLSDKMYSKKELAVVREYANNAFDAHIEAKKPISDFIVTLPVYNDLTLKFRDFGAGLNAEEIVKIYCNMGTSTRRNSNDFNGSWGFGSKSFQCVSDSMTVTSWNKGEKAIYQIIKGDKTKLPQIYEMARIVSDEPTGIEVCIPIKSEMMYDIHQEAANYFKYWEMLPQLVNLNDEYQLQIDKFRTTPATLKGDGWEIRPKSGYAAVAVAYMGNVSYPLDFNKISNQLPIDSKSRALLDLLHSNDLVLKYKMGDLEFVPSREALEYSKLTLEALISKIEDIIVKIKESVQEKFSNAFNIWEAKKIYNSIFGSGLPIETEDGSIAIDNIKILAGNLSKLEDTLKGQLIWNGIPITDASFRHINRFDNALSSDNLDGKDYNPYAPVMTTYRPKKNRIKTFKCKSNVYNGITASDKVGVVINDTNKRSGMAMVMRYLLFSKNYQYKIIHVLNFETNNIKSAFYKEYNFDTVPTLNLSDLLADAKVWYSANKGTRSGGSWTSVIRKMEYMDFVSEEVEESDVAFKDIDEDVYFLYKAPSKRGRKNYFRGNKIKFNDNEIYVSDVMGYIKTINDKLNLDIERVYIIDSITAGAKWFENAIENKTWLPLDKFIVESISSNINPQDLVNQYADTSVINIEEAELLTKELGDNHVLIKLFNTSFSLNKNKDTTGFIDAIQQLYIWCNFVKGIKPTVNIEDIKNEIIKIYPYINWHNMRNGSLNNEISRNNFVKYIKSIDLYNEYTETVKTDVVDLVDIQPEELVTA